LGLQRIRVFAQIIADMPIRPPAGITGQDGRTAISSDQDDGPISDSAVLTATVLASASLNAGRSPGLRLVTRLPSMTTSSSVHSAPALSRSFFRLGQLVTCLDSATPASISVHGPWQIAPIGFCSAANSRMKLIDSSDNRS